MNLRRIPGYDSAATRLCVTNSYHKVFVLKAGKRHMKDHVPLIKVAILCLNKGLYFIMGLH